MTIKHFFSRILTGFVVLQASTAMAAEGLPNQYTIVDNCGSACWSGAYLGAQVGKAWNHFTWDYRNENYFNTLGATVLGFDFDFNQSSALGGLQLGVNYQEGPWVFGVEASAMGGNFEAKEISRFFSSDLYTTKLRWLALGKVRFGYAYDRFLFSVTGGWAGGDLTLNLNDTIAGVVADSSMWARGWTLGAGIDYMVAPHVSVGLGYDFLRIRLNKQEVTCPSCGTGLGFSAPIVDGRDKTQMGTFRVNYFFYQA